MTADDRADEYAHFEIDLPLTSHPFSALKSHNLQFGFAVGGVLGMLGLSGLRISVAGLTADGLGLSSLIGLSLILWSIGLDLPGPLGSAKPDGSAVGQVQLRDKPHYFTSAMAVVYLAVLAASAVVYILF